MTTNQETSLGTEGQAPVRADTLREMLFQAKAERDHAVEKLASSERMRADQANRMAAHAQTIQRLHSLNELVFEKGEGVIIHVRRPDEARSYPILISKDALQATDPARWMADLVDPAAKAVLEAGERSSKWMVDDPALDDIIRGEYSEIQEALGMQASIRCAERVRKMYAKVTELTTKHRSAAASAGMWKLSAEKHQAEIDVLEEELTAFRRIGKRSVAEQAMEEVTPRPPLTHGEIIAQQAEAAAEEANAKRAEGARAQQEIDDAAEERKERVASRRAERAEAAKKAEEEAKDAD